MPKTTPMAEARFAAHNKAKRALTEVEKERLEVAKRTAKLRELRLAKEAADRQAAAPKPARKPKAPAKSKRSPRHY